MKKTYNQRLYGSPITKFLHESRFLWVKKMLHKHNNDSNFRIIELGCLDARLLTYIDQATVDYYYGIDAGWDGYTEQAAQKYKDIDTINFLISTNVDDISSSEKADIAIAMQVFEYIPEDQYKAYLQKLVDIGCQDVYITISNERGMFMVAKLFVKKLLGKNVASYSFKEIWYLITGQMDKIERKANSMKGFDYQSLLKEMDTIYTINEVVGLPFPNLPLAFNFTIAIHARRS